MLRHPAGQSLPDAQAKRAPGIALVQIQVTRERDRLEIHPVPREEVHATVVVIDDLSRLRADGEPHVFRRCQAGELRSDVLDRFEVTDPGLGIL